MIQSNKTLQLKIAPHTQSFSYYVVSYRWVRNFLWHNPFTWNSGKFKILQMTHKSHLDGQLDPEFPVMFENFDEAVKFAKKFKRHPHLLAEHILREKEKYIDLKNKAATAKNPRDRMVIL